MAAEFHEVEPLAFFLDRTELKDGIALCLSGGGYRAMLLHAGAIWRLNELELLRKLDLVSSVSGRSIAAGALAVAWTRLQWDVITGRAANLHDAFLKPIVKQAQAAIDYESPGSGLPTDPAQCHLFGRSGDPRPATGGSDKRLRLPTQPGKYEGEI